MPSAAPQTPLHTQRPSPAGQQRTKQLPNNRSQAGEEAARPAQPRAERELQPEALPRRRGPSTLLLCKPPTSAEEGHPSSHSCESRGCSSTFTLAGRGHES